MSNTMLRPLFAALLMVATLPSAHAVPADSRPRIWVQPDGQRIVKRSLSVDHSQNLYYTLSLSGNGIISGLFIKNESAQTVWWRTDSLLASFINQ